MARKNKRVKATKEEKRHQHYLQLISNGEITSNHLVPKAREKIVNILPRNFKQRRLIASRNGNSSRDRKNAREQRHQSHNGSFGFDSGLDDSKQSL